MRQDGLWIKPVRERDAKRLYPGKHKTRGLGSTAFWALPTAWRTQRTSGAVLRPNTLPVAARDNLEGNFHDRKQSCLRED